MPETVMNGDAKSITSHTDKLSWRISFVKLGRITVSLPLGALFVCFISAIIFKFDEVNQTVCEVCFTFKHCTQCICLDVIFCSQLMGSCRCFVALLSSSLWIVTVCDLCECMVLSKIRWVNERIIVAMLTLSLPVIISRCTYVARKTKKNYCL